MLLVLQMLSEEKRLIIFNEAGTDLSIYLRVCVVQYRQTPQD